MAKNDKADAATKVRVLVAGEYAGTKANVDDVIELSSTDVREHAAQSAVDPDPAAVAYAESLKA